MESGASMRVSRTYLILSNPRRQKNIGLTLDIVDYILFIKANVDLNPNENEVQATQYVTADDLKKKFEDPSLKFTPWFKLICNSMLFEWWSHLDSGLEAYKNEQEIRRM